MKRAYDIIIIDSGLNTEHNSVDYNNYEGIHIFYNKAAEICMDDKINDEIGHGTAIYHILRKENPHARILVIKIFEQDTTCQTSLLIEALRYVLQCCDAKIINLSQGITCCENIRGMKAICDQLLNNGVILVAAFSNYGAISYPAAFDNVIGVDMCLSCKHIYDYEYVDDKEINIRAVGVTQKLPWLKNEFKRVSGTSFSCPYITSYIYKNFLVYKKVPLCDILEEMRKSAKKIYSHVGLKEYDYIFDIKKAIVFPFNKEIHSVIKYTNLETFEICGVYDVKHCGNCGKRISQLLGVEKEKDFLINNFENINWNDDFETVILGHTREICSMLSLDLRKHFIEKCKKYNKKLVSFEDLRSIAMDEYLAGNIYTPIIEKCNVPQNKFGKLYKIGRPIICITGTSVKQGKFSTQLYLRQAFLNAGYKVGGLGTEPSSALFGIDEVYPMGYDSSAYLDGQDEITMINHQLHKIELNEPDIIIVGSQSQTVAYECDNLKYIPIHQNNFLYACDADAYILVCNYFDEDEYILKNITFLRHFSCVEDNIVAIGLFPEINDLQWSCLTGNKKFVDYKCAITRARQIEDKFGIHTFVLGQDEKLLFDECLKYFEEV